MNGNQEILSKVLIQFAALQIILSFAWYFAFKLLGKLNRKFALVFFYSNLSLYLLINLKMIIDLFNQPDLRIGGITFAFEMITLIYSFSHVALLFIIIGLIRAVKKFTSMEKRPPNKLSGICQRTSH